MYRHIIDVTTLGDLLLRAARRVPHEPAIIFPETRLSYQELVDLAYRNARSLCALGVAPGAHVGILMPNCLDFLICLFGIQFAGAVAVPINARYKSDELAYVIADADLHTLVVSDLTSEYADFAALLNGALPELARVPDTTSLSLDSAPALRALVMLGESQPPGFVTQAEFEELGNRVDDQMIDVRRTAVRIRDPAIMMYTSGTTANPKGCPLNHEVLVRSGINMNRERYFLDASDRFWAPLPMFHMAAILPLMCIMDAGAAMLSMTYIEAGEALAMMEREAATVAFPSFPTITNELIAHPDFHKRDLSSLRRINNVAPTDVLRRFQAAFPQAVQTGAYGLTEAGGVIAFNHPDESLETRLTSCGTVFPGIEVRIVDADTLQAVAIDERGEIQIRGYAVFDGYYKAPEKNREAFVDGWFRTGDLCSLDEAGQISFHGRLKDMLKVGGENVAALEIESFLANHPAVKLAQVISVPDEHLLEVPAAFVELHAEASATEAEIIAYCKGSIAGFKVPRHVRFVDAWPMSSTKVQKYVLREWFDRQQAGELG